MDWIEKAKQLKDSGLTYKAVSNKIGVAYHKVTIALKNKSAVRSGVCSKCKKHCRTGFHHTNYLRNTVVELCNSCHTKEHANPKTRANKLRAKIFLETSPMRKLIGKDVIVSFKGIPIRATVVGIDAKFCGRDIIVKIPYNKKPRRFWASKVSELKD